MLGIEPRALCMLGKDSSTKLHTQSAPVFLIQLELATRVCSLRNDKTPPSSKLFNWKKAPPRKDFKNVMAWVGDANGQNLML